jgi:hypothetical protein
VNRLFITNSKHAPNVHILNPDSSVTDRISHLLPNARVFGHPGMPKGLEDVPAILDRCT